MIRSLSNRFSLGGGGSNILSRIASLAMADGGTVDRALLDSEYSQLHSLVKQRASFALVGGISKPGTLYGFNPAGKSLIPLSFSRNSIGTYFDKDGIMRTASANMPRFDYDPATKKFKGILIEKASTNLLIRSSDFTQNWGRTGLVVIDWADKAIAPDGTMSAEKFVPDSTNSASHEVSQMVSFQSGTPVTLSVYAKAGEYHGLKFGAFSSSGSVTNLSGCVFDLKNGTCTGNSASMVYVGNGWYRCMGSGTPNFTGTGNVYLTAQRDGTATFFTGDGVSGVYMWGAQFEASSFATSYIPTAASQVTRELDTAENLEGIGNWFNPSAGTLLSATSGFATAAANRSLMYFSGSSVGSGTGRINIGISSGQSMTAMVQGNDGTPVQAFLSGPNIAAPLTENQVVKHAFRYSANSGLSANGYPVHTFATILPTNITKLYIGSRVGSLEVLNGWVKNACYLPQSIEDSLLQSLSA